jgi:hypothetical protein
MSGTTVAPSLNQGTHPKHGGIMFRGPFLGTFLGKQKGTNTSNGNIESANRISVTIKIPTNQGQERLLGNNLLTTQIEQALL